MTKMQAAALLLAGALTIGLSGCRAASTLLGQSTEPTDPQSGLIIGTHSTVPGPEAETIFAFGEPITERVFPDDIVSVVVNRADFYSSFEEAGIDPHDEKRINLFDSGISVLNQDGSLTEGTQIAMVDVTVTALVSPDGSGAFSENQHILSVCLTYDQKVTSFNNFYFDFAETDIVHRAPPDKLATDFYYYWLPEGESVDMKLGFLLSKRNFSEQAVYLTFRGDGTDAGKQQFVLLHKGEST